MIKKSLWTILLLGFTILVGCECNNCQETTEQNDNSQSEAATPDPSAIPITEIEIPTEKPIATSSKKTSTWKTSWNQAKRTTSSTAMKETNAEEKR